MVIDRNRITGGGVTAGIDSGLTLLAELFDQQRAEATQLMLEYNPALPFNAGDPTCAPTAVHQAVLAALASYDTQLSNAVHAAASQELPT